MSKIHHKGVDLSDLLPFIKEKTIGNIKYMLKLAWDEFVFGGHLLALGASGIILTAAILLEEKPSLILLLLGYALAQVVYSYDHFQDIKKDALTNPARAAHFKKEKYFQLTFPVYCLLLLGSLFYLKSLALALIVFLILAGGLLSAKTAKKLTQKIPGFKNFYISFFWALLIIATQSYYNYPFNLLIVVLFLFVFLRFLVSTIFFDIKDIKADTASKLKTIPIVLKRKKTITYLHALNLISFLPLLIAINKLSLRKYAFPLILFYIYSFYYLEKSKNNNVNVQRLSYVLVDGEYILWPIALLAGKLFF